ncbi:MAG: tetratricopeptide repeat protein, partial [Candidatus Bathyarchaeota archaeon]|nr:tetratricopeptide repeat protein [Candidatus Bathyarchaeota archaeon]
HHGLAMQPVTEEFVKGSLKPMELPETIDGTPFRAHVDLWPPVVTEDGQSGEVAYEMTHALGGKNIYYFLTPMERGRLQVLPLAYDVREEQWFDTTSSMVRHFEDRVDQPLHWTERPLTFNTSCYGCHVSQLSKNYDPETDSYDTTWLEPGINCETCHGPGGEHVKVCEEAPDGEPPDDLKIILTSSFSSEQSNAMCAPCHAKMNPITASFVPGKKYFDHFNLHTIENADFYPDGRDLGENYTFTQWRLSPCVSIGELDCLHCHTSSGRNRFAGERANEACLPCHEELVSNPYEHSHHSGEEPSQCIACHMPKTTFARMVRHDHSLLPPVPAATLRFGSPNACNICHEDQEAEWADEWVRKWYRKDYQAPFLSRGSLVDQARKEDWTELVKMLDYIEDDTSSEIFVTTLIRLLANCPKDEKWETILKAAKHDSPLVRSAAVADLQPGMGQDFLRALVEATKDEFRLVRTTAASSLAGYPVELLSPDDRRSVLAALEEYEASLFSRPDDWSFLYSLGNYLTNLGRLRQAIEAFERSVRLEPSAVPPRVNGAMVFARLGDTEEARAWLEDAFEREPNNAFVNFNLGLLFGELKEEERAEEYLRRTLEVDPNFHQAAYNLGVLLADKNPRESMKWCKTALELNPSDPKYSYTFAFYLYKSQDREKATRVLEEALRLGSADFGIYSLLSAIYEEAGDRESVRRVYRHAAKNPRLSPQERHPFESRLNRF